MSGAAQRRGVPRSRHPEAVHAYVVEGLSLRQCADRFGVSMQRIHAVLSELEIPRRAQHFHHGRRRGPDRAKVAP